MAEAAAPHATTKETFVTTNIALPGGGPDIVVRQRKKRAHRPPPPRPLQNGVAKTGKSKRRPPAAAVVKPPGVRSLGLVPLAQRRLALRAGMRAAQPYLETELTRFVDSKLQRLARHLARRLYLSDINDISKAVVKDFGARDLLALYPGIDYVEPPASATMDKQQPVVVD